MNTSISPAATQRYEDMNNKSVSISKGTLDHLNVKRVIKGKNFRRMSLPKIKGVNQ